MKTILVTGADGFIGSHLTELLVREGFKVKAFVLYNSFNNWGWLDDIPYEIKNEVEVITGDIRDPYKIQNTIKGCDVVAHLAALIAIPYSYSAPESYLETNIKGTLNIIQAARDLGINQVIHTSTSEVYGTAKYVPIDESHPLCGQSPYAASKIGADQMALSFFYSFNTPITVIRPFNTYGPRQSMRAVIPTIINQIASGKKKIKLGSITPTRDFSYIEDTITGFKNAIGCKKSIGKIINLGSNFEISIKDTVNLISSLMGEEITIETDKDRERPENSEVRRLFSCNKYAKEILNWEPKLKGEKGFIKGLSNTINWFKKKENLLKYKLDIYNK